ncbi:hypothetical protein L218DRAFT_1074462 [Marasmius fiardii PR-910]|nr:hypothetical protein L218DRAFT_1074462 [Marasmius fiardii PR-910]
MSVSRFSIAQTSVPYDILHAIFSFCLCEAGREERDILPLYFARVSATWRAAALQTPKFWSRLLFGRSRAPNIHLLYDHRLQLSGDSPITLDIHADRHLTEEEIGVVTKYASRVEKLIVNPTAYCYVTCTIFRQLKHISFPGLSQFEYLVDSVPGSLLRVTRKVDEDDPFRLPKVDRHYKVQWEPWQFGTITELTWGFLYSSAQPNHMEFECILNCCKASLEVMEYLGSSPPSDIGSPEPLKRMIFPRLRSLVWGYAGDLLPVIYMVRAPDLQELTIRNIAYCPSTPNMNHYPKKHVEDDSITGVSLFRDFVALHQDYIARLQALHLFGCILDYETLRTVLMSTSALHTLTLYANRTGSEDPHYFDALLDRDRDYDRLTTLTVALATSDLGVYLQKRKTVLEDCTVTTSGYRQLLEWEKFANKEPQKDQGREKGSREGSLRGLTRCVKNLWVIEEPVEDECVSMMPYIQPIVDGRWAVSPLQVDGEDEGQQTRSLHGRSTVQYI